MVGVIGLGYVGLSLIATYVFAGIKAIAFDVDTKKAKALNAGKSYITHIKNSTIKGWLDKKSFEAMVAMDRLKEADLILICMPTPSTSSRDPDLKYVESTTQAIKQCLRPSQLVLLESTPYPGTTRDVITPILEESGSVDGTDFFVPYSLQETLSTQPARYLNWLGALSLLAPAWRLNFMSKPLQA